MTALTPLETLYDIERGKNLPLPATLAALYGRLQFPTGDTQPYIIGNFVTTLDGVVSLNMPDKAGGGSISGSNKHDTMLMGLLRATADAVIVGAGTLRAVPHHIWTAEYIYPPLAREYQQLRTNLGKLEPPLNVIVTAQGEIDFTLPVFRSSDVPVLLVTTMQGAQRIHALSLPSTVRVTATGDTHFLKAQDILESVKQTRQCETILVEGGPHLMGDFFAGQCLDELFLTLAPQVAGRDGKSNRPGLIEGQLFAPDNPRWGTLIGVKRAENYLFLRYAFTRRPHI